MEIKESESRVAVESPQHGPIILAELASLRRQLDARRLNVAMPDGRTALAVNEIVTEALESLENFGPLHSAHEGIGLLDEEFNKELKDEVYKKECKRDPNKMRNEAKQVASLALRFMLDCCDPKNQEAPQSGCVRPA